MNTCRFPECLKLFIMNGEVKQSKVHTFGFFSIQFTVIRLKNIIFFYWGLRVIISGFPCTIFEEIN